MALTVGTPTKTGVFGDLKYVVVPVTFDNSYPTGGETLDLDLLGLSSVVAVTNAGASYDAQGTVVPAWDAANSKLVAYGANGAAAGSAALTEVANAADLSTITVTLLVLGK